MLIKSGISMGFIVLISRITGFFRAFLIAYYFGATGITDAYFSAFKISNFFRQLLGEGALGNAFIPIYNELAEKKGDREAHKFICITLNLLFIFATIITILMIIFSHQIIDIIVSGFDASTRNEATRLLKIMSFYFVFISLSGMIGAILNNFKYFVIPAMTSIFFNFAIIISAIWFGKNCGITALAYGVVVGGILQFLWVLPTFIKVMKKYSFSIDIKNSAIKKLILMTLPMLVGIMARQLNSVVDQWFASHLMQGSVSALENATRLYLLPVGVFGVSLSTVIYPSLSRAIARDNLEEAKNYILKGLNVLLFLVVPAIAVFTIYSHDVVNITLSYGKFGNTATDMTSFALMFYSLGLYFYVGIYMMTKAFYSMGNSRFPVFASVIAIIINIILNAMLINDFAYKGLAIATAISSGVNFMLLMIFYRKYYINFKLSKIIKFAIKCVIISLVAILISYKIKLSFLRLFVFGVIYFLLWARSIYKYKLEAF